MSKDASVGEFQYDGHLVFNGLYTTNIIDAGFDLEQIVDENLTDFSVGSPDAPSDGYRILNFHQHVKESPEVEAGLEDKVDHMHGIRYEYEEWDHREVHEDGELKTNDVRDTDSFDIYWSSPDYLFVKGNKTEARKAKQLLEYELSEYIKVSEIEFDPDFLLWMFSRKKSNQSFGENLSASMLTDCEIEGEQRDRYGKRNTVDNSTDVTKSTTALMGILRNKALTGLEGVFEIDGRFVAANLSSEGRVHIKADQDISGSSKIERMALSLYFLDVLIDLYDQWVDLPPEDRFPPKEFFRDIYDECEKQGAEVTFPVKDVIKEYRNKGNREEYQERQSGLGEY
ncbi:hypothetical protein EGH24_02330 [Halonotius terrestris]|uniref:Uncharacterized protein n=1 Tax=Halonotius terrestris TaxID=2487750 RepID=A0A8J8TCL7_9EURY|nr:hypothetical protein [Halonotius terrestris]TQQ83648.1 hypothetical protein EGH24_02330 [Halonotius terrestris]